MRRSTIAFLLLALTAGIIGYSIDQQLMSSEVAKVACYIFLVGFLVSIVVNFLRGGPQK